MQLSSTPANVSLAKYATAASSRIGSRSDTTGVARSVRSALRATTIAVPRALARARLLPLRWPTLCNTALLASMRKHGKKSTRRLMLCMPILNKSRHAVGVAQLLNKRGGGAFTVQDEQVFASISAHLAVSLINAELYSEMVRDMHAAER